MRTWKIEGPPEMVEGIVMKVMTSCALRPASRARNPPIAWMPSWELPAMRMTASDILETLGVPPSARFVTAESLIKFINQSSSARRKVRQLTKSVRITMSIKYRHPAPGVKS